MRARHRFALRGAVLALSALGSLSCAAAEDRSLSQSPPPRRLAVTWTTLAGEGRLQVYAARAPWEAVSPVLPVGRWAWLHFAFDHLYAVSDESDTITRIDTRTWTVTHVLTFTPDESVQDIAVVAPNRAYISRRGATHLLRWNPRTGVMTASVDLSPLADADGIPEMGRMIAHEGRLFIQVERTAGVVADGEIAVVDLASQQIIDVRPELPGVQGVELYGDFAKGDMQIVPETRSLYVAATGWFHDQGSVEKIDLDTFDNRGRVLIESEDGPSAEITAFLFTRADRGYFSFSTDFAQSSHLHRFVHPGGWIPEQELNGVLHYFTLAMAHERETDELYLPVINGVKAFDVESGEPLAGGPVIPTMGQPDDVLLLRNAK